jgi:hypothetical protein
LAQKSGYIPEKFIGINACHTKEGMNPIALNTLEPVSFHPAIFFEMFDDRFDFSLKYKHYRHDQWIYNT